MLVVRKFNPIYSNQGPAFPSSSSSSSPHLVKPHQICQHTAQKSGGLSSHFLSHSLFTRPLLYFFPPLSLSVSLALSFTCFVFLSFSPVCLRCFFSFFLFLFFSASHFVSIIISLHLFPSDATSASHILPASPSLRLLTLFICLPPSLSPLAPCVFHFTTTSSRLLSCCCLSWWHVEEHGYTELDEN